MFVWGEIDPKLCSENGVKHSPVVFSVGGWDRNRDSVLLLSKAEMRVFWWMPCPGLISCGEMQLSLCPHERTHTQSRRQAHLSRQTLASHALWVWGVLSAAASPENNELESAGARAPYHTFQMQKQAPAGESQRGRISVCESRGQGEKNQHCQQHMSPLQRRSANTGLQSLRNRANSCCFQLHGRRSPVSLNSLQEGMKTLRTAVGFLLSCVRYDSNEFIGINAVFSLLSRRSHGSAGKALIL